MDKYYYAKGRRKRASATIRLFEGKGESLVNDKPANEVFNLAMQQQKLYTPLSITNNKTKFYFTAKVMGGGVSGQLGAVVHALSRSLVVADSENNKDILKKAGLLTRDDRKKERKKTGLRKARKAPQYSKR